jgi:Protein of unknown function (DUF3631)/Domain of unknown function (DUF3854)
MTGYGAAILRQHAALLEASAVPPEVARARGYVSVDSRAQLQRYDRNFSGKCPMPGLLIPLHRIDGSVWGYQYRPDAPRVMGGKPRKYETPWQQPGGIDIPVAIKGQLGDPAVPLFVTEGSRKADAAVSAGLVCVSLLGVWNWRGSNPVGGKVALAEWHDIALNGRRVVLAFDSDVTRKPAVAEALTGLANYLATKGVKVEYLHLPDLGDGKTGLDDYLAAEGAAGIWELVRPELPGLTTATAVSIPPAAQPAAPAGPVDGAALLADVEAFVRRFVAFPSEAAVVAVTLFAAHTHAAGAAESTPRLALLSPEPGSGKTRTLEVLDVLAARPMHALNASVAAIFRSIEKSRPTLLIDECDAIFTKRGKDDTNEDLRALLNAGHRKSATIPRCVGPAYEVHEFPVYAPVALAGLGDLPATLMSRAVVIRMKRRAPREVIEPFRERAARKDGGPLALRLAAWAEQAGPGLSGAAPDMPEGVTDRPADVWEPLLAVADAAGGDWPKRAREACTELVGAAEDGQASLGVRLLTDMWAIFGIYEAGQPVRISTEEQLFTAVILDRLRGLDESPWDDLRGKALDPRGLATRLRGYEVTSGNIRMGERVAKGYRATDLRDAWARYVPESRKSPTPATTATTATSQVEDPPAVADSLSVANASATANGAGTTPGALNSNVADVADVADLREPEPGDECPVCGEPLDPALMAAGIITHPNCDPVAQPSGAGAPNGAGDGPMDMSAERVEDAALRLVLDTLGGQVISGPRVYTPGPDGFCLNCDRPLAGGHWRGDRCPT